MNVQNIAASMIDKVVVAHNTAFVNQQFKHLPVQTVNEDKPSEVLQSLTMMQTTNRPVYVTDNSSMAALIAAFNQMPSKNKISTLCRGVLDTSALEKEIEDKLLHTTNGDYFYPQASKFQSIYCCDDRILIQTQADTSASYEPLYTKDNTIWGSLLPKTTRFSDIVGTADQFVENLTLPDKARLFLQLLMTSQKASNAAVQALSDVLVMQSETTGYEFVCLSEQSTSVINAYDLYLQIFAGITAPYTIYEVIQKLAKKKLPAYVQLNINAIISHTTISNTLALPEIKALCQSAESLM